MSDRSPPSPVARLRGLIAEWRELVEDLENGQTDPGSFAQRAEARGQIQEAIVQFTPALVSRTYEQLGHLDRRFRAATAASGAAGAATSGPWWRHRHPHGTTGRNNPADPVVDQ